MPTQKGPRTAGLFAYKQMVLHIEIASSSLLAMTVIASEARGNPV